MFSCYAGRQEFLKLTKVVKSICDYEERVFHILHTIMLGIVNSQRNQLTLCNHHLHFYKYNTHLKTILISNTINYLLFN